MSTLLTIAQAAAQICVHPRTIKREIEAGRLRVVMIRSMIRINQSDLTDYVNSNTQQRGTITCPHKGTASGTRTFAPGTVTGFEFLSEKARQKKTRKRMKPASDAK